MEITIKKAQEQDIDAVADLYATVCDYLKDKPFNPNWRRDIFPAREDAAEYLSADGLYVAWNGEAPVGTFALLPEMEGVFCIHEAAVHPGYLRQGIGKAMLDFAAQEAAARRAEAVRLYVWTENTPAIRVYEKNGFIRLGKEDIGLGEFGLPWFYLYERRL